MTTLDKNMKRVYIARKEKKEFVNSFSKVCPRCGALIPLQSKGCDVCLLQFDNKWRKKWK